MAQRMYRLHATCYKNLRNVFDTNSQIDLKKKNTWLATHAHCPSHWINDAMCASDWGLMRVPRDWNLVHATFSCACGILRSRENDLCSNCLWESRLFTVKTCCTGHNAYEEYVLAIYLYSLNQTSGNECVNGQRWAGLYETMKSNYPWVFNHS